MLSRPARDPKDSLWPCAITALVERVGKLELDSDYTIRRVNRSLFFFFLGWTSYWLWRGFIAVTFWRGIWRPFAKHGVPSRVQWRLSPWRYGEGFQAAAPGLTRPSPEWRGAWVTSLCTDSFLSNENVTHQKLPFFYHHYKIYYLFLIKTSCFLGFFKLLVRTVAEQCQWCRVQAQLTVSGRGHILLWAPHKT